MTQPDLFGTAAPATRQPAKCDLPLLLAASPDHATGGALPVAQPSIDGKTPLQIARIIARSVAALTDSNDHTSALDKIATAYRLTAAKAALREISDRHCQLGHMTPALQARRQQVSFEIFRAINLAEPTGEATAILDRCL